MGCDFSGRENQLTMNQRNPNNSYENTYVVIMARSPDSEDVKTRIAQEAGVDAVQSIYRETKNSEAAVVQTEKCTEILHRADPRDPIYQRDYYAVMLAENNRIEEANEVTRALKADIE